MLFAGKAAFKFRQQFLLLLHKNDKIRLRLAGYRVWRDTCKDGLAAFSRNYAAVAELRRARRHAAPPVSPSGPHCQICGRRCTSDFGLRSHLRSHN